MNKNLIENSDKAFKFQAKNNTDTVSFWKESCILISYYPRHSVELYVHLHRVKDEFEMWKFKKQD